MRRRRIVTIGGVPRQLTAKHALRFEVVRGVLTGEIRLDQGARRLRMDIDDLAALVAGARQAVIRTLGEDALDQLEAR
ncbi:MAG TPA: hypothetical protein VLB44_21745 [Kofleriaceae bacterium]|nr:hypothetical protein [Kofleriaceae bacterium]